jgi:hypothetical protein
LKQEKFVGEQGCQRTDKNGDDVCKNRRMRIEKRAYNDGNDGKGNNINIYKTVFYAYSGNDANNQDAKQYEC